MAPVSKRIVFVTSEDIVLAADTFLIKDGKTAVQTFAPKIEPVAPRRA